jgi:hypothetical protein
MMKLRFITLLFTLLTFVVVSAHAQTNTDDLLLSREASASILQALRIEKTVIESSKSMAEQMMPGVKQALMDQKTSPAKVQAFTDRFPSLFQIEMSKPETIKALQAPLIVFLTSRFSLEELIQFAIHTRSKVFQKYLDRRESATPEKLQYKAEELQDLKNIIDSNVFKKFVELEPSLLDEIRPGTSAAGRLAGRLAARQFEKEYEMSK